MGKVFVSYAVGWDLGARAAVGPLSRAGAEARDAAGEPYVMVYRVPGRREPVEVHLVAWGDSYVGMWAYDEQGRRRAEVDWRLLEPERVFLRHLGAWLYDSPEQPEFAAGVTRVRHDLYPDGKGRKVVDRADGGSTHTRPDIAEADRWLSRGALGVRGDGWLLLAGEEHGVRETLDAEEPAEADTTAPAADGLVVTPWLPPRPAEPDHLTELFTPGTRLSTDTEPEMTVLEPREIAGLRLPSGRLVVADPLADGRELAETFAPGVYPVQEAVVAYEYEFMGAHVETEDSVAVRLLLSDEPVVGWEQALSVRDDVRLLRDDECFGYGTDTASGAFADASGWRTHVGQIKEYYAPDGREVPVDFVQDGFLRSVDEATGGDLICFGTGGDGVYPVWLGRSASGEVACFVVVTSYLIDLQVL
ncbi:DUF4241 domain-containing protein [Streptomyces sp. NPDC004539]|uniref:DUF4241 domain-containing protein n=1 Tax=Streptomyces sp. NPDC004539 TaxID=3154280 RepID=UPI0033A60341